MGGAALDEVAHLGALGFGDRFAELDVELDAGAGAAVGEEEFGVEAGGVAAVLFEVLGGPVEDFSHGPSLGGGAVR